MNKIRRYQHGVGLVEILVALLVLAIGVLGFVALQYRAAEATVEGTSRIQAVNLARDLAEKIRVNRSAILTYEAQLSTPADQLTFNNNCYNVNCTTTQLADFDVAQTVMKSRDLGMVMNIIDCPLNKDGRLCVYIAWGETAPLNGQANNTGNCTTTGEVTGYDPQSTCLIMEVY